MSRGFSTLKAKTHMHSGTPPPEVSFTTGFQEPRGVLEDFDTVGIWVHPSFATTVLRFVNDKVSSSICLVSLYDHQGCLGAVGHYLCGLRLRHQGWDSSLPLWWFSAGEIVAHYGHGPVKGMTLVLGPIEFRVLFGWEDLPPSHASFRGT